MENRLNLVVFESNPIALLVSVTTANRFAISLLQGTSPLTNAERCLRDTPIV